jgi:hypothetical protein
MKTLIIQSTIHDSVSMPWKMMECDADGCCDVIKRGCIPAFHDGEEWGSLMEEADEVYEVDRITAHRFQNQIK